MSDVSVDFGSRIAEIAEQIERKYGVRVMRVEPRRVVDELVARFYVSPLEWFKWWSLQGELIPWVTRWWQLGDRRVIYLNGELLKEIVARSVEKAGSQNKLTLRLESLGERISGSVFNVVLTGKQKRIAVKSLRALLSYLDRGYVTVSSKIDALGRFRAIREPKLPFDIRTPAGVRLVARALSDGFLWYRGKRFAEPHFRYTTDLMGLRETEVYLARDLLQVFGKINWKVRPRKVDKGVWFEIETSIVGFVLNKAGVPVGRKADADPGLPLSIKWSEKSFHREYLRQAFDDEGTASSYLGLERVVDLTKRLRSTKSLGLERNSNG